MPIPSDLVATIDKSERLGQAIYVQDKASWIATDALVEEIGLLDDTAIAGWLTLLEAHEAFKPTGTWLVEFFSIEEPPKIFRADHPFLFVLRDTKTGMILFMGRVADPSTE